MSANNLPQVLHLEAAQQQFSEAIAFAAERFKKELTTALSTLTPQPAEGMVDKMYEELCWHFGDQSDPETLKKIATNFAALIPVQQEQTGEELENDHLRHALRLSADFLEQNGYPTLADGARKAIEIAQSLRHAQPGNEVAAIEAFSEWARKNRIANLEDEPDGRNWYWPERFETFGRMSFAELYTLYTQSLHQ